MTREEAIKILSILKAAYPNSYKGMTRDEASGTINIWAMQFTDIPVSIVSIAVNKLISTSTFPPSISEVKKKILSLYIEANNMLLQHKYATQGVKITGDENEEPIFIGTALNENTLAMCEQIVSVTEKYRCSESLEPSLGQLLANYPVAIDKGKNDNLLGG